MRNARHRDLERYLGRLFGYAYSLCGDSDDAKDLVQECALKALAARSVPVAEAAYRAWLFKILRHAFLDRARSQKVRAAYLELEAPLAGPAEYWQADERFINVVAVKLELSKLAPAHREIIGLVDIAGLSYVDAAATLDVPVGTVMSRISRARAALMTALREGNVRMLPIRTRR